jgi:hypothetical protein
VTPYERIAVVTDPSIVDDPAVAVSSALGRHVGALELIAVSADRTTARFTRTRLERVAAQHGWAPAACTVLVGGDRAATLLRHLSRRRRAVVVFALSERRCDVSAASMLDDVVAPAGRPVLVVGPDVDPAYTPHPGTLVVAVGDTPADAATVRAVATWATTFGPDIVLRGTGGEAGTAGDGLQAWQDALVREDITIVVPTALSDDGTEVVAGPNPVVVISCEGTAGSPAPLDTGELLRHAHHPVLVVPRTDMGPSIAPSARQSAHAVVG